MDIFKNFKKFFSKRKVVPDVSLNIIQNNDIQILTIEPTKVFSSRIRITFNNPHGLMAKEVREFPFDDDILLIKVLSVENETTIICKKFNPHIYVWSNQPGVYKVGMTSWQFIIERIKQTDTTGVLNKINLLREYQLNVKTDKEAKEIERTIHNNLPGRIRKNREGFMCDLSIIDRIINEIILKFNVKQKKDFGPIIPRYYQFDCIENSEKYFESNDKGHLISFCGTGKSYYPFWIWNKIKKIIQEPKNLIVVLAPSRQLVLQTSGDVTFLAKSYGYNVHKLNIVSGSDLDSTENIDVISDFLKASKNVHNSLNLIVCTYQSYSKLRDSLRISKIIPDIVVYDETHRLTGYEGKDWINCILDTVIPAKKKLFMTATPIHYTPESKGFIGMNNEKIFGKCFHEYLYLDAVEDGYITPTEIYMLESTNDDIENLKKLINENKKIIVSDLFDDEKYESYMTFLVSLHCTLISLRDGIFTHPIIYSNTVSRVEKFIECLKVISPEYGVKIDFCAVYQAKDQIKKRIDELEGIFTRSKIAVVGNCRCLQEGISVKSIDGEVFIDPRNSPSDITQCVGRGTRLFEGKKINSVIIPIITEKDEKGNYIVGDNSKFSITRDILFNLAMCDEDLGKIVIEGNYKFICNDITRRGIDLKDVQPLKEKMINISGGNRIHPNDKPEEQRVELLMKDITKSLNLERIFEARDITLAKDDNDIKISRKLSDYRSKFEYELEASLNNFDKKWIRSKYSKLIKSKGEHIMNFSQLCGLEYDESEEILNPFLVKIDEMTTQLKEKIREVIKNDNF